MKLSHWLLGGMLAVGVAAWADDKAAPKFTAYGEAMVEDARTALPLKDVLAKADDLKDQTVRVSGVVQDVCRTKGCWIKMTDETVRLKATSSPSTRSASRRPSRAS